MSLWGGRFSESADDSLRALNDSLRFDIRLVQEDIRGSQKYAKALAKAGVITDEECAMIRAGLDLVKQEFENKRFEFALGDEDIHTAVERRLIEIVGAVGGKLHTGRSRNDQVATDFRLWCMRAADEMDDLLHALQVTIINQAEQHVETLMPGYTHLQPAQPITAAHWLMSFFWMLRRDRQRLLQARERVAVSPLGSGALAGTPFPVDRSFLADELGFHSVSQNSLDAVSDRDFVAELLFVLAMVGTHLSRLGEDIILYSNPSFGFITLADRYSTGSSLMPQKRNADPMELARGKAGRLLGNLTGFMTTLKGLPSGYNKDLQEDKEAIFDSFDTLKTLLPVIIGITQTLQMNADAMRAALAEELLATDLADYLVRKGVPFRDAHHISGAVVKKADETQTRLSELSLETLQEISDVFAEDVHDVFDFNAAVARKSQPGGTGFTAVQDQIALAKQFIGMEKP